MVAVTCTEILAAALCLDLGTMRYMSTGRPLSCGMHCRCSRVHCARGSAARAFAGERIKSSAR